MYKVELSKRQIILLKSLISVGMDTNIIINKLVFKQINTQLNKGVKKG